MKFVWTIGKDFPKIEVIRIVCLCVNWKSN